MKRLSLLIVPLFLLTVLAVAVAAEIPEKAGIPAGVQDRLDQYAASSHAGGEVTIHHAVRARRPWNFAEKMSHLVLGDSVYYQTDQPLTWKQASGPMPLPYPPKELWCILVEERDAGSGELTPTALFVALHMDMYSADWLVHTAPKGLAPSELAGILNWLGCVVEE